MVYQKYEWSLKISTKEVLTAKVQVVMVNILENSKENAILLSDNCKESFPYTRKMSNCKIWVQKRKHFPKSYAKKKTRLKVSKFQNQLMKSSFLPKYEQKHTTGQKSWQFFVHFLEKRWLHKLILKFTCLYWSARQSQSKFQNTGKLLNLALL